MDLCQVIVEASDLKINEDIIPDARQYNRWCLCVNMATPTKRKPEGYEGGRQMVLWALLMGVVHCDEGFFSLSNYRAAKNWTYGEITKRLK